MGYVAQLRPYLDGASIKLILSHDLRLGRNVLKPHNWDGFSIGT